MARTRGGADSRHGAVRSGARADRVEPGRGIGAGEGGDRAHGARLASRIAAAHRRDGRNRVERGSRLYGHDFRRARRICSAHDRCLHPA